MSESISYRDFVRELKGMVERNNKEGLQEQLEAYQDHPDVPWDSLFKDIYLHACLKKKPDIIKWLEEIYETMPPMQKIALRQIFAYGRYLAGSVQ
jgi:hypothetical protein